MLEASRLRCIAVLLPFALAGCASTIDDLPFPSHGASHQVKNERVEVGFGSSGSPPSLIQALADLGADASVTEAIDAACTVPPIPPGMPALGAAVAVLAPLVLNWAASEATRAINEYESSFEATWSGRAVDEFYSPGSIGSNGLPPQRHRCIYVVRRAGSGTSPVFLYVAELRASSDGRALRLVPRLVSYSGTKARTGYGGRFSAVMTLTIEAVWTDGRSGVQATRGTVLTATANLGQRALPASPATPVLLTEAEQSRQASSWLPGVPVSISPQGLASGSGPFTATVTMTEAATSRDLVGRAAAAARDGVNRGVVLIRDELGLPQQAAPAAASSSPRR